MNSSPFMVSECVAVPYAISSTCRQHGKGPYGHRCDMWSTLKYRPVFPPSGRAYSRYSGSSTTYALVHALSYEAFYIFPHRSLTFTTGTLWIVPHHPRPQQVATRVNGHQHHRFRTPRAEAARVLRTPSHPSFTFHHPRSQQVAASRFATAF